MADEVTLDERIDHWSKTLDGYVERGVIATRAEIAASVGAVESTDPAVVDARVQRGVLVLVKGLLDADPAVNRQFVKQTGWKILDQLLVAARLKELTRCKIVKGGRSGGLKYDCGPLADTFYGKQVLEGLGFGARRRILDKEEYERVRAEFAKIKLTLPEAIEPTVTERFFAGEG